MIWLPVSHAAIRDCRGVSRRDEARAAGLDGSYLARLERDGIRSPSPEVIASLAGALDVAPEAIAIDLSVDRLLSELVAKLDHGDRFDAVAALVDLLRGERT